MTSRPSLAAILLAGGESRRLGFPKQLLKYEGQTLLDRSIAAIESVIVLDPIIVVLPPSADIVPDPHVKRSLLVRRPGTDGCSASLRAGLNALPSTIDAVAVLPVDQPDLGADAIEASVFEWTKDRPIAFAVRFGEQISHPFIFRHDVFDRLRSARGERGMWKLLTDLDSVTYFDVDGPAPDDVDTWIDYERLMAGDNRTTGSDT